jgi:hypothetical protein
VTILDEQPRTTLGGAAADALIEEARHRQRRRWWSIGTSIVAVILAVALLTGLNGPNLLTRALGLQRPPVNFAGVVSTDHGALRLLGFHGLQIAVPARWRLEDQRCGAAQADTVLYPDLAFQLCFLGSAPNITVVNFLDAKTKADLYWGSAALQTVAALQNVTDQGQNVSVGWLAASRQSPRLLVLYASEVGAAVTIQSPSTATAERIMSSVRLVSVDADGCPSKVSDLRPAGPSPLPGASRDLVPGSPTGVALCRYDSLWLAESAHDSGRALSTLVTTLNAMKPGTSRGGGYDAAKEEGVCTQLTEQGFLLSFSYPTGAWERVFVHIDGCGQLSATNGSRSGQITWPIVTALVDAVGSEPFPDPSELVGVAPGG